MKKLILTLLFVIGIGCVAEARDYTTTNVSELPTKARTYLRNNFNAAVNHINIDKNVFGKKDYEVILANGTEVDFDNDGNMTEVDCGRQAVPASVIPPVIARYVKDNFRGRTVTKIDVSSKKYEIELDNGVDLEFDRSGRFLRMDD